jgi:hypothetical protein
VSIWKVFRVFVKVAKPVASILGIRPKTVAGKVADIAQVVDQALPPPGADPPSASQQPP